MQMVVCQLGPGESLYAEAGKFLWKTANVSMETRLSKGDGPPAAEAGGGGMGLLKKAMTTATDVGKRALAGESLAFQHYRASGEGM